MSPLAFLLSTHLCVLPYDDISHMRAHTKGEMRWPTGLSRVPIWLGPVAHVNRPFIKLCQTNLFIQELSCPEDFSNCAVYIGSIRKMLYQQRQKCLEQTYALIGSYRLSLKIKISDLLSIMLRTWGSLDK
ncbi:hypothetical protein XELAEV_18022468mg [Xenopus laevis]|uniref:Uncharacterized protein n=1 Tax=Xenopus laevis TaxID=8355 RepID=A0A974HNF4_XENLA|nr:hypothetical protein XELAEV_18022468mg [Xenopus laevis]